MLRVGKNRNFKAIYLQQFYLNIRSMFHITKVCNLNKIYKHIAVK